MSNKFTKKAQNCLNRAMEYSREFGHTYIGSEHLLLALTKEDDCIASKLIQERNIQSDKLKQIIIEWTGTGVLSTVSATDMTPKLKNIIEVSSSESIRISSTTALGTANDRILADIQGERVEIGFNNKYLLDALKVCDTDEITLRLNGSVSPIIIVPEDDGSLIYERNFLFMVLPVRMN